MESSFSEYIDRIWLKIRGMDKKYSLERRKSPRPNFPGPTPTRESPSTSNLSDQAPARESPFGTMRKYRLIVFLKEAGVDIDPNEYKTKPDEIDKRLQNGVVSKNKKMGYKVDMDGQDCFAVYARGLEIDSGDEIERWKWRTESDSNGIEVAEVLNVRWVGVKGSFKTEDFPHKVSYKVSFQLKLTPESTMKGQMVNLKLNLPDGTNQDKPKPLPIQTDGWHELEVGQFDMTAQNMGEMKFAMEQSFEKWQSGLIIRCVEIKSINRDPRQ